MRDQIPLDPLWPLLPLASVGDLPLCDADEARDCGPLIQQAQPLPGSCVDSQALGGVRCDLRHAGPVRLHLRGRAHKTSREVAQMLASSHQDPDAINHCAGPPPWHYQMWVAPDAVLPPSPPALAGYLYEPEAKSPPSGYQSRLERPPRV